MLYKFASRQHGFSLLELVVVIFILAALGGLSIVAAGNVQESAAKQLAYAEMAQIKQAVLQHKRDTGAFLTQSHPADFSALFVTMQSWDINSGRGYRGPYLSAAKDGWVDVGDNLLANGSGSPVLGNTVQKHGLADPFMHMPTINGGYEPCEETGAVCVLDWRAAITSAPYRLWGRPYFLFDLNNSDARLVSMGPDGQYAGENGTDACLPFVFPNGNVSDDVVLCLLR